MAEGRTISRRQFLGSVSAAAVTASAAAFLPGSEVSVLRRPAAGNLSSGKYEKVSWKVQPFPMEQVRLRSGVCQNAQEINRRYLHLLPNDRLLYSFRETAGIAPNAEPFGGWESPKSELRGHFNGGHFLSACALMYASTGDEDLKTKAGTLVNELARCQKALGTGYLGAYPTEFYDRLRSGQKVWAPFYTYHKIMAGHLDMYLHCGNEQALDIVEKMAGWVEKWLYPISDDHLAWIQHVEFGGMNEILFNLYAVTGKGEYLALGHRFDHKQFFAPLAEHRDELAGLHTNTNIPKIIGAAREYELTGDRRFFDIADYFWREVTLQRAYCTGGTSNGEGWGLGGKISTELGPAAEECCCSYNMMKLTRHLYGWSANPAFFDYYERLLYNVRLGTQDPDGMLMYYVSLTPGLYKTFGTPFKSFWCCTGTGVEEYSKMNDSIYFHDERDLYVNLFLASEVNWPEKELRFTQDTNFPEQEGTTLTISAKKPVNIAVNIRVPYWATRGVAVKVNGNPQLVNAQPSSYVSLDRTWNNGDKIEVSLPMSLHTSATADDASVQAMMYGPLVLAGRMGKEGLTKEKIYGELGPDLRDNAPLPPPPAIQASEQDPLGWVEPVPGKVHSFRTTGQKNPMTLSPLYQILDERYTVYWKVNT